MHPKRGIYYSLANRLFFLRKGQISFEMIHFYVINGLLQITLCETLCLCAFPDKSGQVVASFFLVF